MKKLAASLLTGIFLAGTTVSTASAASYQVEKGNTLWGIAQEHNVSVQQIKEWNDMTDNLIFPQQSIKLSKEKNHNKQQSQQTNRHKQQKHYTIKSGDTLSEIAYQYGMTVEQLMNWNNLESSLIYPGDVLVVKQAEDIQSKADNTKPSHHVYTVKSGDTLYGISQSVGVSVPQLKAWNHLSSSLIYPGQTLQLNGESVEQSANEATVQHSTATATSHVHQVSRHSESTASPEGKTMTMTATAYTANCVGCSGITATGMNLNKNPNANVIAVDPDVIPLGSKVYVEGYGYAVAADVGGAIQGRKIDVLVPTKEKAYQWGVRQVQVTIVNEG